MSREKIISDIKQGNQNTLSELYAKHRSHFVLWFVNKYNCSYDEGRELYQKVFITFYESIVDGKLSKIDSNVSTVLIGIGKNLFKNQQRKDERKSRVESFYMVDEDQVTEIYVEDQAEFFFQKKQLETVKRLLQTMGEECQNILELYFYHKLSMKQIAERLGIEKEQNVKSKKFRCLAHLRGLYRNAIK